MTCMRMSEFANLERIPCLSPGDSEKYAHSTTMNHKSVQVGPDHVAEVISTGTSDERTDLKTVVCRTLEGFFLG